MPKQELPLTERTEVAIFCSITMLMDPVQSIRETLDELHLHGLTGIVQRRAVNEYHDGTYRWA